MTVYADRVLCPVATVGGAGAGDATAGAADVGYQDFSAVPDGSRVQVVFDLDSPNGDVDDWEVGSGIVTAGVVARSAGTYSVLSSSNGGAKITLTNTHKMSIDITADILNSTALFIENVYLDHASGNLWAGADIGLTPGTGIDNTGWGRRNFANLLNGGEHTTYGAYAGEKIINSMRAVYIGKDAGRNNDANDSAIVGKDGMSKATAAPQNAGLGNWVLFNLTNGADWAAVGFYAASGATTGVRGVAMGARSANGLQTGNYDISIGYESAFASPSISSSINISYRGTVTKSRQAMIGSEHVDGRLDEFFIGSGVDCVNPRALFMSTANGSGTDVAGSPLTIAAGRCTGAGTPATIKMQAAAASTTGTVQNVLKTLLTINPTIAANESGLEILFNDGVSEVTRRVLVGAADSAGVGYRTLRVAN